MPSKESSEHLKDVMPLLVEEMRFARSAMKVQFVNVKIVSFGIQNLLPVKNLQFLNVLSRLIVSKTRLVVLMFSAFSNASQFVLNSTAHRFLFALLKITKEVVNVCQAIEEIQMIETVAHQIAKINVQIMPNVPNLKCVFVNKEFRNVFKLATVFDAVPTPFA